MSRSAAIYARISQDRDGSALGIERQEQDCRALADSLGWTVTDVFVDNNRSAYSGKRRPEYERLLAAIESGHIQAVVAWAPDRLHRSPAELERYIDIAERRSVVTNTVKSGAWDLSTPSGRAVARTLGAWARYESEHKGDRIARAARQRAEQGKHHGGSRPFGYKDNGVDLDPIESEIVREMFEKVLAGVSLRKIVHSLNGRNVPTARGNRWTALQARSIVMNGRYAGYRMHKGEPIAKAVWPAIVSEDVWRAALTIVTDPSRDTNGGRGAEVRWLGSGLYICGVCGTRQIRCSSSGNKMPAYRCIEREMTGTIAHVNRNARKLDEYVESVLVARLTQPDALELLTPKSPAVDVAALYVEQSALASRQDELAGLYAAGSVTARQLTTATSTIEKQLSGIAEQIRTATFTDPLRAIANSPDVAAAWYGSDTTPALDLGSKRAILDALLDVTINRTPMRGRFDYDAIGMEWKQ
ncbi:recombinase family protein [Gordonia sp. MP11Mi]